MSTEFDNDAPVHPQLMDPASDPEEFIAASIYWYPLIFPTRTEVLDHTLLTNGNGYEWNEDGQVRSVFAHIEPDYDRLDHYEAEAQKYEAEAAGERTAEGREFLLGWAADQRKEQARLLAIRANYRPLARTYGPVRTTIDYGPAKRKARMVGRGELSWTLLGRALGMQNDTVVSIVGPPPASIAPAWQRVIDEALLLFADILVEQGVLF